MGFGRQWFRQDIIQDQKNLSQRQEPRVAGATSLSIFSDTVSVPGLAPVYVSIRNLTSLHFNSGISYLNPSYQNFSAPRAATTPCSSPSCLCYIPNTYHMEQTCHKFVE